MSLVHVFSDLFFQHLIGKSHLIKNKDIFHIHGARVKQYKQNSTLSTTCHAFTCIEFYFSLHQCHCVECVISHSGILCSQLPLDLFEIIQHSILLFQISSHFNSANLAIALLLRAALHCNCVALFASIIIAIKIFLLLFCMRAFLIKFSLF